jgi:hypothetical protein
LGKPAAEASESDIDSASPICANNKLQNVVNAAVMIICVCTEVTEARKFKLTHPMEESSAGRPSMYLHAMRCRASRVHSEEIEETYSFKNI